MSRTLASNGVGSSFFEQKYHVSQRKASLCLHLEHSVKAGNNTFYKYETAKQYM